MQLKFLQKYLIFFILAIFFVIQSFSLFNDADIWWDPAVYVEMGKYMFSDGNSGLWEPYRPILWPVILGFFWKMGLDPIFFGNLMSIALATVCIYIAYLICKKIFDMNTGIVAAFILSFTPTFFFFSGIPFSEMCSLMFLLLGIYFYFEKKIALCGLAFGLSFITRVFYVFVFFSLSLVICYEVFKRREKISRLILMGCYFFIPVLFYLLFNLFMYRDMFLPFIEQTWMTVNVGWVWSEPFYFYFFQIIKENLLSIFAIAGIIFIFPGGGMNKRNQTIFLAVFLIIFLPFNVFEQKEVRFMVLFWPVICVLIGYGIIMVFNKIKNQKMAWSYLILLLIVFCVYSLPQLKFNEYNDEYDIIYNYEKEHKLENPIWISNPSYIVHTDYNASLIYYPRFDLAKMEKLNFEMRDAKTVMINTCDIPCPPSEILCEESKSRFIEELKNKYELRAYDKKWICEFMVLVKN